MAKPETKKAPLTADEAAWLMKIYQLRYDNLFFAGFFRCLLYSLAVCTVITNFLIAFGVLFFNGKEDSFLTTSIASNLLFNGCLAFGLAVIICWVVHNYLILPYKTDSLSGMKLKVPFIIAAKEYYPVTGQYFFRFENDYEKLFEVDEDTYDSSEEGGIMYMDQGIKSGHVFGANDHVVVKFFTISRSNRYYSW